MKTTKIILLGMLISFGLNSTAQVAINNDGSAPDNSAILDVKSTTQGLLLPRMNTMQISGINNPAAGLVVFNTDSSDFYGYNGAKWISLWNTGDTLADWYCGNPLIDSRDSNSYSTVQIGSQCWMAENLNVGTRINGNIYQANNGTIEKYCMYNDTNHCDIYGGLYQWFEMMQYETGSGVQGICPDGWHLPTDSEWKGLEIELGMSQGAANATGWRGTVEGEKMKSTSGWNGNGNGTNSSGFNALPGGDVTSSGSFYGFLSFGHWWSSSEVSGTPAWYRSLSYDRDQVARNYISKAYGFSVRCIKNY